MCNAQGRFVVSVGHESGDVELYLQWELVEEEKRRIETFELTLLTQKGRARGQAEAGMCNAQGRFVLRIRHESVDRELYLLWELVEEGLSISSKSIIVILVDSRSPAQKEQQRQWVQSAVAMPQSAPRAWREKAELIGQRCTRSKAQPASG